MAEVKYTPFPFGNSPLALVADIGHWQKQARVSHLSAKKTVHY